MTQSTNPLEEMGKMSKKVPSCILVIFGATGDLTARKLIPALYNLAREGQLPAHFAVVGFARRPKTHEDFRSEMLDAINKYSRVKPVENSVWNTFKEQIFYHQSEFDDDKGYDSLKSFLQELDYKFSTKGNRVFYLSTQPSYFPDIVERLHHHELLNNEPDKPWSRVIIEKPFGHDLQSALELQKHLSQYLDESQIYRIDHYLGKETVQNLLVFRFSNPIFESVWNNHHVDHVQITVSEEQGIGTRGRFWEEAGMLRDIIQNHMMQLLSLVAMEPPSSMTAHAIHEEKVKVMEAIHPIAKDQIDKYVIRGQYAPGYIDGKPVIGYRQETNVDPASNVETYVAMELAIDNWRWTGVPFYIRSGKRLPKRVSEIAITFKAPPGALFQGSATPPAGNSLVIRIQPDEGISFKMNCKVPGTSSPIQPVKMDFKYGNYFGLSPPEAYERLLCDCMLGDGTLFARADEVMASWRLLDPVLVHWKETLPQFPNYPSGSWGPDAANELLARSGRQWRLL